MPLFLLIDLLLSRPRIARALFDRFRTRDNLRTVLQVCHAPSTYQMPRSGALHGL